MKEFNLSAMEKFAILNALLFYRDETTHDPEGSGIAGLNPKNEEYKLISSVINKLVGDDLK